MSGQDIGPSDKIRRKGEPSGVRSLLIVYAALAVALSFYSSEMGLNFFLSHLAGLVGSFMAFAVIAYFGGLYQTDRVLGAAVRFEMAALLLTAFLIAGGLFAVIPALFLMFVAFVFCLDYIGFGPFASFIIALLISLAPVLLIVL